MENSTTRNELFIMKLLTQTQEGNITWSKVNESDIRITKIHNIIGKSFQCTIGNKDVIIYKYEFRDAVPHWNQWKYSCPDGEKSVCINGDD